MAARILLRLPHSSIRHGIGRLRVTLHQSRAEIALPAAVRRASSISLMGSGLGNVGLDKLALSIRGVLDAAGVAGLSLDHRCVPLSDIEATWAEPDQGRRVVYTVGTGFA
ncbi:MAG: hypothetical protein ACRYGP_11475 [Janthinobacterium lividum]